MASSRAQRLSAKRPDGVGSVALQESQSRGLLVVEPARFELLEGLLVGEAVGQALDELHRRADALLGGEALQRFEVVELAHQAAQARPW